MLISDRQGHLDRQQAHINRLSMDAKVALDRLVVAVIDACPGTHEAVQHRDMRPPWCPHCGRTDRGVRIKHVDQ